MLSVEMVVDGGDGALRYSPLSSSVERAGDGIHVTATLVVGVHDKRSILG